MLTGTHCRIWMPRACATLYPLCMSVHWDWTPALGGSCEDPAAPSCACSALPRLHLLSCHTLLKGRGRGLGVLQAGLQIPIPTM